MRLAFKEKLRITHFKNFGRSESPEKAPAITLARFECQFFDDSSNLEISDQIILQD